MEKTISKTDSKVVKSAQFLIEVIIDDSETEMKETYIIRTPQGQPIRVVDSAFGVCDFLNELTDVTKVEGDSSHE